MIDKDLQLMDETINLIKSKNDTLSYFSQNSLHKFEFRLFLTLYIVRFELQTGGQISDQTAAAINHLSAFGAFEYYRSDFPEVYAKCSKLFYSLSNYNQRLKDHELKIAMGVEDDTWIDYFNSQIAYLVLTNEPNN